MRRRIFTQLGSFFGLRGEAKAKRDNQQGCPVGLRATSMFDPVQALRSGTPLSWWLPRSLKRIRSIDGLRCEEISASAWDRSKDR
jgi:hypothetical protein